MSWLVNQYTMRKIKLLISNRFLNLWIKISPWNWYIYIHAYIYNIYIYICSISHLQECKMCTIRQTYINKRTQWLYDRKSIAFFGIPKIQLKNSLYCSFFNCHGFQFQTETENLFSNCQGKIILLHYTSL